ncbi:MAG: AAA family ATPase [Candidatus Accumulibacter sp.]|uniref:AAA family ATPase n=1 Tax=Accumulibacter sp. TaxID=2053492 RepID=UPI0019DAFC58|nr:AAA family ATPase [Accumulibacter sp.]MBE2259357.1 AAA family ATPase [Paracoccaceae bacterium]MCB1940824.1 AAA family ATPase [Accumulibacter sp.]MCP5249421.1 AAA family ATPase [Accumulibacter sp.]
MHTYLRNPFSDAGSAPASPGRVIAVVSQKGGAGKTTVAVQLAGGFHERRASVMLVDLDPQESAYRWAESAPLLDSDLQLDVRKMSGLELIKHVGELQKEVDYVVLDTPPSIYHPSTLAALAVAHLAVIPAVPSPTDLWSTLAVERLILNRMEQSHRLHGCILPNRVQNTALATDVLELLHEFTLPILDAMLCQRNAYPQSAVIGGSVFQLASGADAAQGEVRKLIAAVLKQLGEH